MPIPSSNKSSRRSSIELLRILSMFFIVSFHLSYKSGFDFSEPTANALFIKSLWLLGELGTNLFMLITGYFLANSKGFQAKKLILLLSEILFYYLSSSLIQVLIEHNTVTFDTRTLLILLLPTTRGCYWYATAYVVLYILSPWISQFVRGLDQTRLVKLLATLLVLYSVIPTIVGIFFSSTEIFLLYSRLLWLFIIYLCGSFLRIFPFRPIDSIRKSALMFASSFAVMIASIIFISNNQSLLQSLGLSTEWAFFWPPNTTPMFLASLGLFGLFLKLNVRPLPFVNKFASTTFGIYLIHDGPLQGVIWGGLVAAASHQASSFAFLFFYVLISAVIVFIVCACIDALRQAVENVTLKRLLDSESFKKLGQKTSAAIDYAISKLTL